MTCTSEQTTPKYTYIFTFIELYVYFLFRISCKNVRGRSGNVFLVIFLKKKFFLDKTLFFHFHLRNFQLKIIISHSLLAGTAPSINSKQIQHKKIKLVPILNLESNCISWVGVPKSNI